MAWNPSPEVAVARDAAQKLDDADQCIVIYLNWKKQRIGMASYGRTKELCVEAKKLGEIAFDAINDCLKD
jgi:hypothetical protein